MLRIKIEREMSNSENRSGRLLSFEFCPVLMSVELCEAIIRPTLVIDEKRVRSNIEFMKNKANSAGVSFRPHFKTHQSRVVGGWFSEVGIDKIAVSSIGMAEYFAEAGWKDILVAFPLNVREMASVVELARQISLHVLVESEDVVAKLEASLVGDVRVGAFVKADIGYHRTGIDPMNVDAIERVVSSVEKSEHVVFDGFLGHAGHSYHTFDDAGLSKLHESSLEFMKDLDKRYRSRFPQMVITVGDTPCCSRMSSFAPANEIRPGNFVYYDLEQFAAGSCQEDSIAVAVFCPVVAVHPERNEVVIYGGGIHFAKQELDNPKYPPCFGMGVEYTASGLGKLVRDVIIKSLSQEHGVVSAPREVIEKLKVGDLMAFVPVHSCMTAECLKDGLTFTGQRCDHYSFSSLK